MRLRPVSRQAPAHSPGRRTRNAPATAAALVLLAGIGSPAQAQALFTGFADPGSRVTQRAAAPRGGVAAFAIEMLGGAAGSAAGFGIGVLVAGADECDNENLLCILEDVAIAVGGSTIGAGFGAWGAGRLASTGPSGLGAALGSIAGAFAALGVVHLITEDLDLHPSDAMQFVSFTLTQGMVAALGSRLLAAIRD